MTGWDELLTPWIEPVTPSMRGATPLRYVVAMIRHILEHLNEPLRGEDIAAVVGLHPNYALNLFTSVMNVSLHRFVVRMRLIRARRRRPFAGTRISETRSVTGTVTVSSSPDR